jgi:hypothetical protein
MACCDDLERRLAAQHGQAARGEIDVLVLFVDLGNHQGVIAAIIDAQRAGRRIDVLHRADHQRVVQPGANSKGQEDNERRSSGAWSS